MFRSCLPGPDLPENYTFLWAALGSEASKVLRFKDLAEFIVYICEIAADSSNHHRRLIQSKASFSIPSSFLLVFDRILDILLLKSPLLVCCHSHLQGRGLPCKRT